MLLVVDRLSIVPGGFCPNLDLKTSVNGSNKHFMCRRFEKENVENKELVR